MLRLICGPSGAGKTEMLTSLIRADIEHGIRCFLLVPEQQAYISERDLPAVLPENAGLYFEVVNFSGLAGDVFREYGGVTQSSVDNGIRSLLMWDTLRTLSPMLRQYGKSARSDSALTALMLGAVQELRINGVTPDCLEAAASEIPEDNPLRTKLRDLALVDALFREKTENACGSDPSDQLLRMAEILRKNSFFSGCRLYIDSFTSFTAQEYSVLRCILEQADEVTVSICADSFTSALPHFESAVRTAKRLNKLATDAGIKTEKKVLLPKTEEKPAVLSMLEHDLWRFELKKENRRLPSREESGVVRLTVAGNIYEESEAVAIEINELLQGGMHYGDIAVVVRDTEEYRGVLDAAFERRGIPFFLSERTDLSAKPLARLILSALRAVCRNYHVSDIMSLVKSGLTGAQPRDAALFEEYCETWHITGNRFTDEVWNMNPDGLTTERSERAEEILDAANRVRKTVMEPLNALSASLRLSDLLSDRCRSLYEYLCHLHIAERLYDRARAELSLGQARQAEETLRLFRFVNETLVKLCTLLPDSHMTTDEFLAALSLLFSVTDLGSVPNAHDCVIIGSAATLRVENIRCSFLMGLCEGDFPRAVSDDGILTDSDKTILEGLGVLLDSRESVRSSEELMYVYRAVTKPRERLFLSTVSARTDGSACSPSLAFSRVSFLTGQTPEIFDLNAVIALSDSVPDTKKAGNLHLPVTPGGGKLWLSQSKIQSFVLCPYRYYSTYCLHLREKKDSRPSYADDGIFLHYVFEHFLRASLDSNGVLKLPPDSETEALADRIITSYLAEVCPLPPEQMDSRMLHLFSRLRSLAVLMLRDITAELKASLFVPSRFEQMIGARDGNGLPAVTLTLNDGTTVLLTGKIDRIDLFHKDDKIYVRVVDYKSGEHTFSLDDVKTGVDIQLILYLFAVLAADPQNTVPAGAQFLYAKSGKETSICRSGFILDDGDIVAAADGSPDGVYSAKLLRQTGEDILKLTEEMNTAVTAVAERILSGEAEKTPSEQACGFCPVRDHCDRAVLPKKGGF